MRSGCHQNKNGLNDAPGEKSQNGEMCGKPKRGED